jgi:protein tyrosine/serine phosphatase
MRPRSGFASAFIVVAAALTLAPACAKKEASSVADGTISARNPRWATPIEKPGLPNFHKVSGDLYRGAQPEAEGFAELKALGVKTIVNLRLLHSDRDEMKAAGLKAGTDFKYMHIKMEAWDADEDELARFLKFVGDPASCPVFVHCKHGADRTGTAAATYRIVCQGWTKEDAIDEMRNGGFNFHAVWKGLPKFLRDMNVEKLRKDAGLDR